MPVIRIAVLALALAAPLPAAALSCRPFGPVEAFREAQSRPERYIVVTGRLAFAEPAGRGGTREIAARVIGRSLTADGFTRPFEGAVTIEVICTGAWCGQVAPGGDYLLFLKKSGFTHRLVASPCQSFAFPDPTPEIEAEMRACMVGGPCGTL